MSVKTRRMLQTGGAIVAGLTVAGAALAATVEKPSQSLSINPNGQVVMTHGELTAISGNTLTVKHHGLSWMVNVTDATKVVRRFYGGSKLTEFRAGDLINVRGVIVEGQLAINATFVRNASIREADFNGKVESVTAPDTFVAARPDGVKRTVKVISDTVVVNAKGETKTFADITVGTGVRVSGIWNRLAEDITARKVVIRLAPAVSPVTNTNTAQ